MAEAAVLMEEAGCGFSQCPGHGSRGKNPNSPFCWLWGASLSSLCPSQPSSPSALLFPGLFWGSSMGGSQKEPSLLALLSPEVTPALFRAGLPNPSWLSLVGIRGVEDLDRKGACLQPFIWLLLKPCVPPDKTPRAFLIFIFTRESSAEISS